MTSNPIFFEPMAPMAPAELVTTCIEQGRDALLLDEALLPREFFDLSTGVLGALVHKLTQYHIRMAVVVADLTAYSPSFRDFVREANRGSQFCFLPTRAEAIAWLERP